VKTLSQEFTKLLKHSFAEELEVDLVEISPNAEPPVCKLMDYGKFLYQQKKRDKELKAKSTQIVLKKFVLDLKQMSMIMNLKEKMLKNS
jgi:translation initiation factor IF-3